MSESPATPGTGPEGIAPDAGPEGTLPSAEHKVKKRRGRAKAPTPQTDPDGLMTLAQGCDFTKMSSRWLHDRMKDGSLPFLRFGRTIRFRKSALVEFCARREKAAES